MGEVDRYNMQRLVSLTANVHGMALGDAARDVRAAIERAGAPPQGVTVNVRGQVPPLEQTVAGLRHRAAAFGGGDLPAAGGEFSIRAAGAGGAVHGAGGTVRGGADAAGHPAPP